MKILWAISGGLQATPQRQESQDEVLAMIVMRLAAEFQGFSRDLHDEAVDCFVSQVAGRTQSVQSILLERMTSGRDLGKGNAHADALDRDFARLGLALWPALEQADPNAIRWRQELTKLNQMRNAIAHDDRSRLQALRQSGYMLTTGLVETWEQTLNSLAGTMDDVVSANLSNLLGCQDLGD
ncbi:hypothetical protein [Planotetraspora sp. GP83]|uniref:hypothetical protein n=1 Tax=Planotetraspora sp. GP83 TaxID=3156264 RepID=UPI0035137032